MLQGGHFKRCKMRKIEITMEDGSVVYATLNMGALLDLRSVDEELYEEYFTIYNKMKAGENAFDELDMYKLIYIGYRCGSRDNDLPMSEFLKSMPDSRAYAGKIFKDLYGVVNHQKKAFQNHSRKPRAKGKEE